MAEQPRRLVISLDYGTTFTGITYGVVETIDGRETVETFVCSDWEGGGGSVKVPSEISYSAGSKGTRQWGFSIAPDSLKLVWTKLELEQQDRQDELTLILNALDGMKNFDPNKIKAGGGLPSYPALDPVEIVAGYLTRIREFVRDNPPQGLDPTFLSTLPVDLVFTVPAGWSDRAKNRAFRAVSMAGFSEENFPRLQNIILVAEPEAAALYTLKTQLEIEGDGLIVPGDCFVLCDAGGGTVDLISYRVKNLLPSIQLEEVDLGTGAKYGATLIDRNFIAWLEEKLVASGHGKYIKRSSEINIGSHTVVEEWMQKILQEFQNIKHQFKGLGDQTENFIALPKPFNKIHNPSNSIIDGEVVITDRDLQAFFEPCVEKIVSMIEAQIGFVKGQGSNVRLVFLTGGFAQSEYLFDAVDKLTSIMEIRTKRPGPSDPERREEQHRHCWSAVMRGAVLRGIERKQGGLISLRKCRRYYGVSVSEPFSSFKHLEENSYIDPFDGERKAQGQMEWLLKRGDALLSRDHKHATIDICRKFGVNDPRIFRTDLLVLDDDAARQRYADIPKNRMKVIEVVYDLSDKTPNQFQCVPAGARGQPYLCAHLKLEIRLDAHLEFKVLFDGGEIKNVVAEYE